MPACVWLQPFVLPPIESFEVWNLQKGGVNKMQYALIKRNLEAPGECVPFNNSSIL